MSNFIANIDLASKYLEIALKCNELEEFLTGDPLYELTLRDMYGNKIYSAMHVMEAIYEKHRNDPDLNLDKMTYDVFVKVLDESCYSRDIINTLSNIEYQINSQKHNNAAFNLDVDDLLSKVRANVLKYADVYKSPEDNEHPDGIWHHVLMHINNLELLTNIRII